MGEAFDAACEGLQDGGQPDLVREIAKRIIEAAKKGEREPLWDTTEKRFRREPL